MAFSYGAVALMIALQSQCIWGSRYLVNDGYTYRLNFSDGSACMTVSMKANIVIFYRSILNNTNDTVVENMNFDLPTKDEADVTGNCTEDTRVLSLTWWQGFSNFTASFRFAVTQSEWYLSQVDIDFDVDNDTFESPEVAGPRSYQTTIGQKLFNRTFSSNQYFYCKACKTLWLKAWNSSVSGNDTGPCYTVRVGDDADVHVCSYMSLQNTVLYPGNLDDNSNVKKKLCLEDFIELQEIIIPAAVGGVLGLLLIIIFCAYLVAYIGRKRREGQYETINDAY